MSHPYRIIECPMCGVRCVGERSLLIHVWRHLSPLSSVGNLNQWLVSPSGVNCVCFCGTAYEVVRQPGNRMSGMAGHWLACGGMTHHLLADVLLRPDGRDGVRLATDRAWGSIAPF